MKVSILDEEFGWFGWLHYLREEEEMELIERIEKLERRVAKLEKDLNIVVNAIREVWQAEIEEMERESRRNIQ